MAANGPNGDGNNANNADWEDWWRAWSVLFNERLRRAQEDEAGGAREVQDFPL